MYVVTAEGGGQQGGCLVGFATQCSIDPPRFWVGISVVNHTYRVAEQSLYLAVHLVGAQQRQLAALFGELTGDRVDKFARCRWRRGPHETVILEDPPAWFVGRIRERVPGGDHTWLMLDPVAAEAAEDLTPLCYQAVADLRAGHPIETR